MSETDALTESPKKKGGGIMNWPISIYFIFGNEFCERFSFYGLRAILYLYLNKYLLFDADASTSAYHAFVFGAYAFPLLGGMLSDSYWGKYKTIIYVSIIYCLGSIVLSITAIPGFPGIAADPRPHWWGCALGLTLIAIGTGGIKPCVASFGGDQFRPDQAELLSSFFAFFYMSINVGSTLSTFITPLLREEVPPHGSGYWAAFGLPAVLLIISLVIFVSGRKHYTMVPPGKNMIALFVQVVKRGVSERFKGTRQPANHWLDRTYPYFDQENVDDIKAMLRILIVFVPLPVFWALFDQHGSRWVGQADRMNRQLGSATITPDQVPILNPVFVMLLIPVFDRVIYPFCRRLKLNMRPLRRMTVGMGLTAASFVVAAFVEMALVSAIYTETPLALQCNPGAAAQQWSFSPNATGAQPLQHVASRLCLVTCDASDGAAGCVPSMATCDGSPQQQFSFQLSSGQIVSHSTNMCLDLQDRTGPAVGLYACVPADAVDATQAWNVSGLVIQNLANTGLCLDLEKIGDEPPHVAWQIPQFFLLTTGEVLVSVSGLEFAYSQSPLSMKSVVMSFWNLTVSIGNLIVVGVAEGVQTNMIGQYFLFAGLMFVFMIIFLFLSRRYTYVEDIRKDESTQDRDDIALLSS